MRFDDQRQKMVESQIIARGVKDESVINSFLKVKREYFVDEQWKSFAYKDHPLSIGNGQTISQPYIVALMMALLDLTPVDKVLEIGTGSGYQTALLAEIVAEVYTIERIEELMSQAKAVLKKLDYKNIFYKNGDGSLGWVNAIPLISEFDKIVVSAGSPKAPESLLAQLKDGGKMVIPQGTMSYQELLVYEKKDGNIVKRSEGACVFVPLIGMEAWNS
jgi:protein-L-isoaspartate(D-aspartate) O-methyltransferase